MCKKELIEKMKTKSSLVVMQSYVKDIMKEKYKENLLDEEIFTLFEKIVDLANDVYEEDNYSERLDLSSIFSVLISLCNKRKINFLETICLSDMQSF
ncbi:MAG: hypothetical protein HFH86_04935 [Bacilli bacterium]|nr:hypothetical protein [Bacilli bacterium]